MGIGENTQSLQAFDAGGFDDAVQRHAAEIMHRKPCQAANGHAGENAPGLSLEEAAQTQGRISNQIVQ